MSQVLTFLLAMVKIQKNGHKSHTQPRTTKLIARVLRQNSLKAHKITTAGKNKTSLFELNWIQTTSAAGEIQIQWNINRLHALKILWSTNLEN
jgi:hypothetical protein